jgi:bilirubin oxidase
MFNCGHLGGEGRVLVAAAVRQHLHTGAWQPIPDFGENLDQPISKQRWFRKVSLNELVSDFFDGPIAALLGTLDSFGEPIPLGWADAITENPALNSIEIWELHNFTEDAHPIHIHEVAFEVFDRKPFGGVARPPEPWETGRKDTVIALPGEITRVKARYDLPGLYVWHCHILEHEDNEMMRPYRIGGSQQTAAGQSRKG